MNHCCSYYALPLYGPSTAKMTLLCLFRLCRCVIIGRIHQTFGGVCELSVSCCKLTVAVNCQMFGVPLLLACLVPLSQLARRLGQTRGRAPGIVA